MAPKTRFSIFAGTANPALAEKVAAALRVPLGRARGERFPDGELSLSLAESVRGRDVFLIQPTGPPVDENLVELLAWLDAFRRASAGRRTVVLPYFGYARQDRLTGRQPVTGRLAASLIERAGADGVLALDLHTPQVEGFFEVPVDHLTALPVLAEYLAPRLPRGTAVVSPDAGFVKQASRYAALLDAPLVVVHKRRLSATQPEVTAVAGEVADRPLLIVDDMITTGGTIARALDALLAAGARAEVTVAATHGLLVPPAAERLSHPAIRAVVVTDSLPLPAERRFQQLTVLSVAGLLAEAIRTLHAGGSLRALHAWLPP